MLFLHPRMVHVARIRLDPAGLDEAVEESRAAARERSLTGVRWWVGDLAQPTDLGERLLALGFERAEETTALALDHPPLGEPAFAARPAADLAEFSQAQELDWEVTGLSAKSRDRLRADLPGSWERQGDYSRTFVVAEAGEVISMGRSSYGDEAVFLSGGATAPAHRRRGAYSATVHARWHDAAAQGTPLLVTQAGPMSAPVLRGLGFREVGRVTLYADRLETV